MKASWQPRNYDQAWERMAASGKDPHGEVAFLDPGSRTADAMVMAPTELLELDRDGLERLERERPDVAVALLLTLGRMQGHYLRQTAEEIQRMANW